MRGLVIGRFQPLHAGHAKLIRTAIEDCVHVVVGVGSSEAREDLRNPFTYEEREAMITSVFGDTVEVRAVPDIHNPPAWVRHVLELVGPVDKVYGNDPHTLDLFDDQDVPVVRTGHFDRDNLEASTIRMQLAEGDPAWRKAVPAEVVPILDRIDAGKRLRLLGARM